MLSERAATNICCWRTSKESNKARWKLTGRQSSNKYLAGRTGSTVQERATVNISTRDENSRIFRDAADQTLPVTEFSEIYYWKIKFSYLSRNIPLQVTFFLLHLGKSGRFRHSVAAEWYCRERLAVINIHTVAPEWVANSARESNNKYILRRMNSIVGGRAIINTSCCRTGSIRQREIESKHT